MNMTDIYRKTATVEEREPGVSQPSYFCAFIRCRDEACKLGYKQWAQARGDDGCGVWNFHAQWAVCEER